MSEDSKHQILHNGRHLLIKFSSCEEKERFLDEVIRPHLNTGDGDFEISVSKAFIE